MTSRTEERRAGGSGPPGTPKGMCLSARGRLARAMGWGRVGLGGGEGGAGVRGEDGMAGDEDEAEQVVADGVVKRGVEVGRGLFEGFEFAGELFVFARGDGVAAEEIDGASFGGCGKPRRGIIGDARLRPLFECGDQRFLREIFG